MNLGTSDDHHRRSTKIKPLRQTERAEASLGMIQNAAGSPESCNADYICVATDLLTRMMSEHKSLEVNNRRSVTVASTIEGQFVISQEELRRSLSVSSRAARPNQGMGLGLSIARRSAKVLGHEFAISTRLNAGTCIQVYVPLAKAP